MINWKEFLTPPEFYATYWNFLQAYEITLHTVSSLYAPPRKHGSTVHLLRLLGTIGAHIDRDANGMRTRDKRSNALDIMLSGWLAKIYLT